jgi:hypothetical protein
MNFHPIKLLAKVFDLTGTDDNPSFSKIGWWAVFIACLMNHQFSIFWGVLFGAWAFGRSAFLSYLATKPVALNAIVGGDVKDIFARRDPKEGIEAAP